MDISFRTGARKIQISLLCVCIVSVISACQNSSPDFRWEAYIDRCNNTIANAAKAGSLQKQDDEWAKAQELVELAFEECKSCSSKDVKLATTLKTQARILEGQYECEKNAEIILKLLAKKAVVYRKWYELASQVYGPKHADTNEALSHLAETLVLLAQFTEAKQLLETSISQLSTKYGDTDLSLASPLHSLGNVFVSQGYLTKAASYFRRALMIERIYLPKGVDQTVDTMSDLAYCVCYTDPRAAEKIYEEAVKLSEELKSARLNKVLIMLANLDSECLGKHDQSEKYLMRVLADKSALSTDLQLSAQFYLGRLYHNRGDLSKASDIYKDIINAAKTAPAAAESVIGVTHMSMAEIAEARGEYRQALESARTAAKYESMRLKQGDVATLFQIYEIMIHMNCKLSNKTDEKEALEKAFEFFLEHSLTGKSLLQQNELTMKAYDMIMHFAVRHAGFDWGKRKFERALTMLSMRRGAASMDAATCSYYYGKYLQGFAENQRSVKLYGDAERRFEDALKCPAFQLSKNHVYWGSLWGSSECSYFLGHWSQSEKCLREAISSKSYSKQLEDTARQRLKVVLQKQGKST